jgi:hypothetical protein
MPLDPATLDTGMPKTLDGREYPEHLKPYEELDTQLLPIAAQLGEFSYDALAVQIPDAKVRSVLPRWLASAEWRNLIERRDHGMSSQRTNVITDRGRAWLQQHR